MELSKEEMEVKAAEDFEAGRKAARGQILPSDDFSEKPKEPETKVTDKVTDDEGQEAHEGKAADDSPADPVVLAGLTESQLKTALAKAGEIDSLKEFHGGEIRKVYGKFGEIQRELSKLSDNGIGKIDAKKFAKMSEMFGEDFATALAEDLSGLTPASNENSAKDLEEKFNNALAEKVSSLSREFEIKLLSLKHPDWKKKRDSTDYDLWFATLPAERQQEIRKSNDGLFAAKTLDDFDAWKLKGEKKNEKKERLDRAITPSGSPPEPPDKQLSADAAFEEGRKAARKRMGMR